MFSGTGGTLNLPGNPADRHRRTFTSDAIEYTRTVVKVYCPDRLDQFEAVADGLDVTESSDR